MALSKKTQSKPQFKKQFIVAGDSGISSAYEDFIKLLGFEGMKFVSFADIMGDNGDKKYTRPDLILFTGGADVDPSLYNEPKGSRTGINKKRDQMESRVFESYFGTPKIGICRGSQLVTVLSGGKLVQDVTGHANGSCHNMTTRYLAPGNLDGNPRRIPTTSTHHQMMFPYNLSNHRYELVAWSTRHLSDQYLNGEDNELELPSHFLEPEVVYYRNTNALAIQGHPEFETAPQEFINFSLKLIKNYLL